MRDESELEELHGALGAEVAQLVIGASPTADVMRDGAVRRTRRRLAVTSGVATLAVLPVAAVVVFAGGAGAKGGAVSTASSPTRTADRTSPNPPPIVVPAPLPAPGQLNPDLPNDSVVVLASGTADGKHWRLVRDRYVVAGPEPANVMGDPSSRPHLPYAANWDKSGTIECDFTGVQWGDGAPGDHSAGFLAGGGCNPTDDGSITRIMGRFAMSSNGIGSRETPAYVEGRIDGTDAAYVTVDIDGQSSGKQPVIEVPGEQNDYYMILLPHVSADYQLLTTTVYNAQGHVLASRQEPRPGMPKRPISVPSSTVGK